MFFEWSLVLKNKSSRIFHKVYRQSICITIEIFQNNGPAFIYVYLFFFFILEHVVSIIKSMLRHCRGTQRQRLMTKFTENDHEKVDRLLELHFKYLDKVELIDQEVENMEKVSISMLTLFTFHKF